MSQEPHNQPTWGVSTAVIGSVVAAVFSQVLFAIGWQITNSDKELDFGLLDPWQILGVNVIIGVLTLLIMAYFIRRSGGKYQQLGFQKFSLVSKANLKKLFGVFGVYIVVSTVAFMLMGLFVSESTLEQAQDTGYNGVAGWGSLVPVFIGLIFVAPIVEELLFRGFMFRGLRKKLAFWPSAIISSLLFAVLHLQLNVGVNVFFMALAGCWLLEKTGSIYSSMLLHILKNLVAFSLVFVFV